MAAWVFFRLGQRQVDVERAEYRTVWTFKDYVPVRTRPEFVPLADELDESLGTRRGDPASSRSADLARGLGRRRFGDARDLDILRERAPRRVA
jgi:hypothetical protein